MLVADELKILLQLTATSTSTNTIVLSPGLPQLQNSRLLQSRVGHLTWATMLDDEKSGPVAEVYASDGIPETGVKAGTAEDREAMRRLGKQQLFRVFWSTISECLELY